MCFGAGPVERNRQHGNRVASKCVEVSRKAAHGIAEQRVKPIHRAGLASRKAQMLRMEESSIEPQANESNGTVVH